MPPHKPLAALDRATGWINSPPLTAPNLRGSVVVIHFWTYTCINWLRSLPHVRAWSAQYADHGLVTIGVHTPEFAFEHRRDNVERAAHDLGVNYPIAHDPDYAIWRGFNNHYWPALYVLDAHGQVRHHHFGEGDYDASETAIRRLLTNAGATVPARPAAVMHAEWKARPTGTTCDPKRPISDHNAPSGSQRPPARHRCASVSTDGRSAEPGRQPRIQSSSTSPTGRSSTASTHAIFTL
jgi:thiol-disulfide isomerase/thioredoxin